MSLELLDLVLVFVVASAFAVEATLGFGATVVTVAIGSLFAPADVILVAFIPVNIALSTILVVRGRRDVAWRILLTTVLPFVALGLPLGLAATAWIDERTLKLALGVMIVGLSALELSADGAGRAQARGELPIWISKPILILGGVLHGAFATGGPMVVYVLGRTLGGDKAKFRATLSVLWLVLGVVLVGTYAVAGKLSVQSAQLSLVFSAAMLVGLWVGERVHAKVDAQRFRTGVFAMLAIVGFVLVLRNARST